MITYNTINVAMPDIAEAEVSAWVKSTAATYNKVVGDINYIFVDDETMLDINRRFTYVGQYDLIFQQLKIPQTMLCFIPT